MMRCDAEGPCFRLGQAFDRRLMNVCADLPFGEGGAPLRAIFLGSIETTRFSVLRYCPFCGESFAKLWNDYAAFDFRATKASDGPTAWRGPRPHLMGRPDGKDPLRSAPVRDRRN